MLRKDCPSASYSSAVPEKRVIRQTNLYPSLATYSPHFSISIFLSQAFQGPTSADLSANPVAERVFEAATSFTIGDTNAISIVDATFCYSTSWCRFPFSLTTSIVAIYIKGISKVNAIMLIHDAIFSVHF